MENPVRLIKRKSVKDLVGMGKLRKEAWSLVGKETLLKKYP